MELDLGPELRAFREDLRSWIAANRVEELENLDKRQQRGLFLGVWMGGTPEQNRAYEVWERRNREARLICPQWPEEYGGRDFDGVRMAILNEELAGARLPRVTRGIGEWLAGASIIAHGTPEQKAYFLPRIISGQDVYCQGFSEPGAGSDLAGVEARGVVAGDEIVITGQKVWTSGADVANTIFVLCRTDPNAPRHRGLSYVIVPIDNNHIEVRPLRQMSGESDFGEEFIDGARAPLFNVIGGLNNGWKVAMTTIEAERGAEASVQHLRYAREFWDLVQATRRLGRTSDPLVRQQLAWAYTHVEIMRYSGLRLLSRLAAGRDPGPGAAVSKLFWSEYHKRFGEIAMEILGPEAMIRPEDEGYATTPWQHTFFWSRAGTIYAGSSQIQRRIIGERVLGLPREPGGS